MDSIKFVYYDSISTKVDSKIEFVWFVVLEMVSSFINAISGVTVFNCLNFKSLRLGFIIAEMNLEP